MERDALFRRGRISRADPGPPYARELIDELAGSVSAMALPAVIRKASEEFGPRAALGRIVRSGSED